MTDKAAPSDEAAQKNILVRTWQEFSEDDCSSLAAALAYYTVFSLPPLLMIVITSVGMIWGEDAVRGRIHEELARVVGSGAADQVSQMAASAAQPGQGLAATLISVGILLFGATGVMAQLQHSLNRTWQVEPDPAKGGVKPFIIKRVLSFAMILVFAFLLLVSMILSSVLSGIARNVGEYLPGQTAQWPVLALDLGITLVVFTGLFAAMFKWLPDVEIAWRNVLLGALVTAVLFVIGKSAIGWYLGRMDIGAFGAAGSLVLVLIWVYYSSMILLIGAEFTQVWARRHGAEIEPSNGAVRVVHSSYKKPDLKM